MVINPIVGVYIPIIRIPIKGGITLSNLSNIGSLDPGALEFILNLFILLLSGQPVKRSIIRGLDIGLFQISTKASILLLGGVFVEDFARTKLPSKNPGRINQSKLRNKRKVTTRGEVLSRNLVGTRMYLMDGFPFWLT